MRCLERMTRRARLPVAVSQGFTPRPKIVFAAPLALGIAGRAEVVDIELSEPIEADALLDRLTRVSPAGLVWLDAAPLPADARAPLPVAAEYCLNLPPERVVPARSALEGLLSSTEVPIVRRRPGKHRETTVNLRAFLEEAEVTGEGTLRARLKIGPDGSARPEELLEALHLRDVLDQGAVLTRTRLELSCD